MTTTESGSGSPAASAADVRDTMLKLAEEMAATGATASAETLRTSVDAWWQMQRAWEQDLTHVLELHHEINNALVGVRGHAQLLLLGPAGHEARVRDRLEVIIRESGRIEKAALELREVRNRLTTGDEARR